MPIEVVYKRDIVLGLTEEGKKITLYKYKETFRNLSMPETLNSSIYSSLLFINANFNNITEIKFKSISLSFSYLSDWLNLKLFKTELNNNRKITISYENPYNFEYNISDDLKLKIVFDTNFFYPMQGTQECFIKTTPFIKLESKDERSFEEFFYEKIFQIRNFLTLGIGKPINFIFLKGENESYRFDNNLYDQIYILFPYPVIQNNISPEITKNNMNFEFKDISNNMEYFLKNWFIKDEVLAQVIDLYFATLYNPKMYLENKFLNLIIIIEGYHRLIFGNKELSDEKHNERINKIYEKISDKYKKWLKSKLEFSNEPNLRNRLKDILYHKIIADLFNKNIEDKDKFIDKVVKTRNNLVHADKKNIENIIKIPQEYLEINEILKKIIEICLF